MKDHRMFRTLLSLFLCLALLAAAAYGMAETAESVLTGGTQETPVTVGEGEKTFLFRMEDLDGNEGWFTVRTDEETVGAALLKAGLIEGEQGPYGLYVKTVCGIFEDYAVNGHYWAFYVNGEYAMSGVDMTAIDAGAVYAMKAE